MKILFVHPATTMSIGDVARGYRSALERSGHEMVDYRLDARLGYHKKALPIQFANDQTIARFASETILNEAMYCQADLVLIMSGLNVHPIALWLLGKAGFRAAVILTESPYEDDAQRQWADLSHVDSSVDLTVFTNDRFSAETNGWHLLPPSFDPAIHHPMDPVDELACDVLIVGTGWPERQQVLEAVDWTGIDLRLYGIWPGITPDSPLAPYYHPRVVDNKGISALYNSAKVNINFHRRSHCALTPGPRVYELAACGAFQISDPRHDLLSLFKGNIPTFDGPVELGEAVHYFLDRPEERKLLAAGALDCVCGEDFDRRVTDLEATLRIGTGSAAAHALQPQPV